MMTDTAQGPKVVEEAAPDRKALRQRLIGKKHEPKSQIVTLFGEQVEIRQPSLAVMLEARVTTDNKDAVIDMIIRYSYVPGTNEQLFDPADRDTIANWPFGEDLLEFQTAIAKLTGVDISTREQELNADPLPD